MKTPLSFTDRLTPLKEGSVKRIILPCPKEKQATVRAQVSYVAKKLGFKMATHIKGDKMEITPYVSEDAPMPKMCPINDSSAIKIIETLCDELVDNAKRLESEALQERKRSEYLYGVISKIKRELEIS